MEGIVRELAAAGSRDDLRDVGRRCREVLIDAARLLADPGLLPDGAEPPKAGDAKGWLDLFLARQAAGRTHRELRAPSSPPLDRGVRGEELLCLDELGYLELDKRGAELLFQVLTEREERTAVAIASNDSFSGWTKTFTDPRLCAAIVDRLTFGGNIIETGTSSYRLAHARSQRTRNA